MSRFKAEANITSNRTGEQKTATITRPADSESAARDSFQRDMRFLDYTIDGGVKVERDDS